MVSIKIWCFFEKAFRKKRAFFLCLNVAGLKLMSIFVQTNCIKMYRSDNLLTQTPN